MICLKIFVIKAHLCSARMSVLEVDKSFGVLMMIRWEVIPQCV